MTVTSPSWLDSLCACAHIGPSPELTPLRLTVNSPRYNFHTSCRKQNGRHRIPTAKRYTNKACKKINNKLKNTKKLWTNHQHKTNTNINIRPAYNSLLLLSLSHDKKFLLVRQDTCSFKTVVVTGLNFKPWMSLKKKNIKLPKEDWMIKRPVDGINDWMRPLFKYCFTCLIADHCRVCVFFHPQSIIIHFLQLHKSCIWL